MKIIGKFWEVADLGNLEQTEFINSWVFLGGFWLKTPLFLWFLLSAIFDAYALKIRAAGCRSCFGNVAHTAR